MLAVMIAGPDKYGFSKYQRLDGSVYYAKPMTDKDRAHYKAVERFYRDRRIWNNRHEIADPLRKEERENGTN